MEARTRAPEATLHGICMASGIRAWALAAALAALAGSASGDVVTIDARAATGETYYVETSSGAVWQESNRCPTLQQALTKCFNPNNLPEDLVPWEPADARVAP